MSLEIADLLERMLEVALEADRAIVEIDMGGRLFVGHFGDEAAQTVLVEPFFYMFRPSNGEHDDAIALLAEGS